MKRAGRAYGGRERRDRPGRRADEEKATRSEPQPPVLHSGLLTNHSLRVADGSERSERFVSETEAFGREKRERSERPTRRGAGSRREWRATEGPRVWWGKGQGNRGPCGGVKSEQGER